MEVVRNISADRVDTADEWEWEKCDQKYRADQAVAPDHPNRSYYRCKSFSQGCLVEKHVEQSRNNPQTFDIMYTDQMHHHCVPGRLGSSTSKLTSSAPKSAERSAKGSSTSRSSSPRKSAERPAEAHSSTSKLTSLPPKSKERAANGSSNTSKSSLAPKSAKRSGKGSSNTSKTSSLPKSADRQL